MSRWIKVVIASGILAFASEALFCARVGGPGQLMDHLAIVALPALFFYIPGILVEELLGHGPRADSGLTPILVVCGGAQFFIIYWSVIAAVTRFISKHKAEPGAPPNGGPAERFGNSGVGGGPPSVS